MCKWKLPWRLEAELQAIQDTWVPALLSSVWVDLCLNNLIPVLALIAFCCVDLALEPMLQVLFKWVFSVSLSFQLKFC